MKRSARLRKAIIGLTALFAVPAALAACDGVQITRNTATPDPNATATSPGGGAGVTPTSATSPAGSVPAAVPSSSPAATSTPVATPTPTPVPPLASFQADVRAGSAPLTVTFTDTTAGPVSVFQWDFGDGTTSDESSPVHEYTKAGTHSVRLTINGIHGSSYATDAITVEPGPIAKIEIFPPDVEIEVDRVATFESIASDDYGNELEVTASWESNAGIIDNDGQLTVGHDVGMYSVVASVGEISGLATVEIQPGAPDAVSITPAVRTLFPGQSQLFAVETKDKYGHSIQDMDLIWAASEQAGSVNMDGLFTAGLDAGTYADGLRVTLTYHGAVKEVSVEVVIDPGLVARWTLDGDLKDSTGAIHGFSAVPAEYFTGISGKALKSNSGSLIQISDSPELALSANSQSSLEVWIYPTSFSSSEVSIGVWKEHYYGLTYLPKTHTLRAHVHSGVAWQISDAAVELPVHSWTHVIQSWDGEHLRIYVNGTLIASAESTVTDARVGRSETYLGALNSNNDGHFVGLLDNVAIFHRALGSAEIAHRFAQGAATAPFDGLAHFWHADGTTDDAIGSVHGIRQGGAGYGEGISGFAFELNGVNDFISLSEEVKLTGELTISAWVNFEEERYGEYQSIFNNGSIFFGKSSDAIGPGNEGRNHWYLCMDFESTGFCWFSILPASPAMWEHVAVTWNGRDARLYVDGNVMISSGWNSSLRPGSMVPTIGLGASFNPAAYPLAGRIDEIQIYDRALSHDEIRNLYGANKP